MKVMDNEGQVENKTEWLANERDDKESNDNEDKGSDMKQMVGEKSNKKQR